MPQADAKDRDVGLEHGARRGHGVGQGGRVARSIAEKDAVGLDGQEFVSQSGGRKDLDLAPVRHEAAKDVPLQSEIVRRDTKRATGAPLRR